MYFKYKREKIIHFFLFEILQDAHFSLPFLIISYFPIFCALAAAARGKVKWGFSFRYHSISFQDYLLSAKLLYSWRWSTRKRVHHPILTAIILDRTFPSTHSRNMDLFHFFSFSLCSIYAVRVSELWTEWKMCPYFSPSYWKCK